LVDFAFIEVIFALKSLFDVVFRLFLDNLAFGEQHLFLDTDDGFWLRLVGVELESDFGQYCQIKAGLSNEFFEVISVLLCNISIVHDDLFKLVLFVVLRSEL
jgi:hypothetical protein